MTLFFYNLSLPVMMSWIVFDRQLFMLFHLSYLTHYIVLILNQSMDECQLRPIIDNK